MWLKAAPRTVLVPSDMVRTKSWLSVLSPLKKEPILSRVRGGAAHIWTNEADWNHRSWYDVARAVAMLANCWVVNWSFWLVEQSRRSARKVWLILRGRLLLQWTKRMMSTTRKIAMRTEIMMAATFHLKTSGNFLRQERRGSRQPQLCLISLIDQQLYISDISNKIAKRIAIQEYMKFSLSSFLSIILCDNNFMFEQLLNCLLPNKTLSEQETGRVIDHLRTLPLFNSLTSAFGAEYLAFMLPLLQPYLLRQGLTLIGQHCQYLLLEGNLREVEEQYQANRTIEPNRVLDLRDKEGLRFVAQSDCKIIKIKKGASAGLVHFQKRLLQKERERNQEMSKLKKLMKTKQHKEKLEFLKAIEFFSSLGQYDLLDLTIQSHLKQYSQGGITHVSGEDVEAIGCVLNGKVKLSFPMSQQGKRQAVSTFLAQGEWVGLEEYLWEGNFKSDGEAASISTLVVWIPREVFKSKFNLKTNYRTMSKIMSLIQTKKALFDRSLDCRRRKDIEINAEGEALKNMNAQLLQKISAMVTHQEKRKNNFRKAKPVQEVQLPQHLLHRSNLIDPSPNILLPKLLQRINLFPQQYQHTAISVSQLREMQRLAQIVKNQHGDHKEEFHQFPQHNPEAIYKTILNQIPHFQPRSTAATARLNNTVRESRWSGAHSNYSIYNNFRVSRSQPRRSLPKSKTLQILS